MTKRAGFLLAGIVLLACGAAVSVAAEKYEGPRPPKPDVPFLLHASRLEETEASMSKRESAKNADTFVVANPASPARTPLAEPIFIMQAEKISPDRLELYRFDVKNGRREVTIKKRSGKQLHLTVRRLEGRLWRIEAAEPLENGEYGITPDGSDVVFCFQVY